MRGFAIAMILAVVSVPAGAADLVALYDFNNSFNSSVGAAQTLDAVGTGAFTTDDVFTATNRSVYHWDGANFPTTDQGGLVFDNSGGALPSDSYSIAMVVKLDSRDGAWRRLVDVQDRASDNGFYVDPSNTLDIYPHNGSTSPVVAGAYRNIALTVASDNTVDAYIDGTLAFSTTTDIMNINNPQNVVNFFLDNTIAGGQGEWTSGSVARISLYNGVLTGDEVAAINVGPLLAPVPEPGEWAMMFAGLGIVGAFAKRRRAA